ncbi:MAG: transglutaminase domain-containing protein [bacterium]|nr:transglutaminase domain-containing protein [bacterium]
MQDQTLGVRVQENLDRHLDGERIGVWLKSLPDGSLQQEAATWILAWLPLSDCAALDLPMLREHVEGAVRTYEEAPWKDELPRKLWLHFVVPHRVSQEPAQAWREEFRALIWPRVKDAETMELAALAVTRWCREQATFKSTSGRDMGPLTTVARGIGRCEEEMILNICALRSVGIPARACSTPYWSFTDNNHAWVEVWADGRWWFLGGCEPGECLNNAWFAASARRTGFVRSTGYGEFDPSPEPLYRAQDGSTVINSTAVYTDPIHVTVNLDAGWAGPDTWVYVNVLNFGSLRSIAKVKSGTMIDLGPGEYAFTAGDGEELLLEVAGGPSGEIIELSLDGEDRYDLDASPGFWLRYPESAARPARNLKLVTDVQNAAMNRRIASRAGDRNKLREPSAKEQELIDALPELEGTRFRSVLTKPFTHVSTLVDLLGYYSDAGGREAVLTFLAAADDKDLLELDADAMRSHIDGALQTRSLRGMQIPDDVFAEGLLACRIEREPGGAWREDIEVVVVGEETPRQALGMALMTWVDHTDKTTGGLLGTRLNPAQTWQLGVGTTIDLKVGLVGFLRCQGFPARYSHGKVEAWVDGWLVVDAVTGLVIDPDGGGGGSKGQLDLAFTRGGQRYDGAESYKNFNVARLKAGYLQAPWWDPSLGQQEWDAGPHILCSVNRVPGGSVYGRLRRFEVQSGETTYVELPLDIGPGWDPGNRFFSGPKPADFFEKLMEAKLHQAGDQLIFVAEAGEPCDRMLTSLAAVAPRLRSGGITLRFLFVPKAEGDLLPDTLGATLIELGFEKPTFMSRATAVSLVGADTTDPLVALRLRGQMIYLRTGFDTAVGSNLNWAVDLQSD